VARGDSRTLEAVGRVACQWNRTVHGGVLARLFRRRAPLVFSAEDYALVTRAVATTILERTLTHIALLRDGGRPRLGIRALALLERVETGVALEIERRRGASVGRHDLPGPVRGRWAVG
jgi:hypothetical protein